MTNVRLQNFSIRILCFHIAISLKAMHSECVYTLLEQDPATGAVRPSALEGLESVEDIDAGADAGGDSSEGAVVEEDVLQGTTVN